MGKISGYLKSSLYGFFILSLLYGGYRGCRYLVPPTPSVYKVAIDSTWYPLSLYGNDSAITAFSIDVLFAAAKSEKIKVELVRSGPRQVLDLLEDGQVQGILTGIRKEQLSGDDYYFSDPYYRFGAVLVLRQDVPFSSLMDLPGKRIAVRRNSPILFRVQIDPRMTVVPFDSPVIALDQLSRNQLDGVVMDQLLSYLYFSGMHKNELKVVTLPLTMDGLYLVTYADGVGKKLVDRFNKGLTKIKENGSYGQFLIQWDLYDPEVLLNSKQPQ